MLRTDVHREHCRSEEDDRKRFTGLKIIYINEGPHFSRVPTSPGYFKNPQKCTYIIMQGQKDR